MKKSKLIFLVSSAAVFLLALAFMITGFVVTNTTSRYNAAGKISVASAKAAVLTQSGERTAVVYQNEDGTRVVAYDSNGETLWTHELGAYYTLLDSVGENVFVGAGRTIEVLDKSGAVVDTFGVSYTPRTMSVKGDKFVVNSSLSAAKNLLSVYTYGGDGIKLDYELDFTSNIVQTTVTEDGRVMFATSVAVFECVKGAGGRYSAKKLFDSLNTVRGFYVDGRDNVYLTTANGYLEIYRKTENGYAGIKAIGFGKDSSVISADGAGMIGAFDYAGNVILYDTVTGEVYSEFDAYESASSLSLASEGTVAVYKSGSPLSYYDTDRTGRISFFQSVQIFSVILVVLMAISTCVAVLLCFENSGKKVKHIAKELNKSKKVYLFLLPTFALLLIFNYYTLFKGLALAFQDYTPGIKAEFVGFANFARVFTDSEFWASTGNMLIFLVTDILKALIPPFLIAEIIHSVKSQRSQYVARFLMFLPGILPGVAGSLLWMDGIFGTEGVVSQLFGLLGVDGLATMNWLGNARTAKWSLVMFGFPWVGNYLLCYGALKSIPESVYEAADLDGFSWFRRLVRIDLPMIGAQMKYMFMTTFISSIQNFSRVFITTNGAFDTNIPALVLYQNITTHQNYGVASAMGIVLFVFIFGVAAYSMKSRKEAA